MRRDHSTSREAVTRFEVLERFRGAALVRVSPKTGRTHQIRVHLKHLGHPVAGDRTYGGGADYPRQLLHAWKIAVTHPATGELMEFTAPLPADFPLRPDKTEA